jgi:hypothetical protein
MSQVESSSQKELPSGDDAPVPAQARMVDLWMSARKERREVIPPSRTSKVESLRSLTPVTISNPKDPQIIPIPAPSARIPEPPAIPVLPAIEPSPAHTDAPSSSAPVHLASSKSGSSRKFEVLKTAFTVAQKMLPLLEGNVALTVSNLLSPGSSGAASRRDIAAIEDRLTRLNVTSQALSDNVSEQKQAIIQISDRIDQLKEATNRNTLEQQELMEDARGLRKKFLVAGGIVIGLLIVSVALNIIVLFKLAR